MRGDDKTLGELRVGERTKISLKARPCARHPTAFDSIRLHNTSPAVIYGTWLWSLGQSTERVLVACTDNGQTIY